MFNLKEFSKACLLAIVCLTISSTAAAQDQTRFVLKLDDNLISSFRNFRSLRSNVPPEFKGKITLVELQFPETKDVPPVEMDLNLSLDGDNASLQMTEKTISILKAQPIRVAVAADKNQFSQIVLNFLSAAENTPAPPYVAATGPKVNQVGSETPIAGPANAAGPTEGIYFIRIGGNQTMSGNMGEFELLELNTKFGTVQISAEQLAGIKFHTDGEDSAVVVLGNGDSITGIPAMDVLKLTTDWGLAEIDISSVDSLTTIPATSFSQESTDWGTRWVLKTNAATAAEKKNQSLQVR